MKIIRAEPLHRYHFNDTHIGPLDRLFFRVKREGSNFNRRMFDEDFARIFYSTRRNSDRLFNVSSNDEELTEKLLSNFHTRYGSYSADDKIREIVEEIAQLLIWFGGAAYYFLYHDPDGDDINIRSFGSSGLIRVFGANFQWVPKRTAKHWDHEDEVIPREIRILDSTKVIHFVMPKAIKRLLSAQNRTLSVLDKHQFGVAGFLPQATYENPNPPNHFDFGVWRDTQQRALYRSTRGTGWNCRKQDSSKCSDFFDCLRLIRFRRNQLLLRDSILSQLSAALSKVGKCDKADFAVEISCTDALSNTKHLDKLEESLNREEVGFTEIINYCFQC